MKGYYDFAGLPVEVETICLDTASRFAGYETQEAPILFVHTTKEDIAFERRMALKTNKGTASDEELEYLAVYRSISEQMPFYQRMLFHGSAVSVDGNAYIFTAPSGTGKSTHTALWRQVFKERAVMINDDKPIIQLEQDRALVHGTPYTGKHRLGGRIAAPIRGICLLERGLKNAVWPVSKKEIYPFLLRQTYRPNQTQAFAQTLTLLDELCRTTGLFRMTCTMDPEAAEIAYQTMGGTPK